MPRIWQLPVIAMVFLTGGCLETAEGDDASADAGRGDGGLPVADAGSAHGDAQVELVDGGGAGLEDAAVALADAGAVLDSGVAPDSGVSVVDAGAPVDSGVVRDAGSPVVDAGRPRTDAGVVTRFDGGVTELSQLAASMAPGTWAPLPVEGQNEVLGVGGVSGTMLHYSNHLPWNRATHVVEIIGMDHGYPSLRHVRYVEATNRFVLVADNAGLGAAHGYDHNAVNPYTGDLYHRVYSGFSGHISSRRKVLGADAFTDLPDLTTTDQVAIGACWWSGHFVGAGAQGAFMLFNSGNSTGGASDGVIAAFDPLTDKWFYNEAGKAPFYGSGYTYHSVIEYSEKLNVAVYGGGNVAPRKLWRLNEDGSFVTMPDVPTGKAVGIQGGLLVDEPVTGHFLLLSAGELWELDPTGDGQWSQLGGSSTPPAAVGIPGPTNPVAVIVSSIPDYGVVMVITQPSQNGGNVYLYKHP